jgi:hypothetical protein
MATTTTTATTIITQTSVYLTLFADNGRWVDIKSQLCTLINVTVQENKNSMHLGHSINVYIVESMNNICCR